ncbi:hypothetical protein RLDS_12250 [Sphingobium lactosutens DS20]|uniref:Uncharacterized protein n=1 Tax=Sphingobium lactosutens DS20 TaxID=1331060 RepID=T0ISY3_9SPHN|nr:hypothetical protein RLDS_12250 [Sphingobium lactosutens DS20]
MAALVAGATSMVAVDATGSRRDLGWQRRYLYRE